MTREKPTYISHPKPILATNDYLLRMSPDSVYKYNRRCKSKSPTHMASSFGVIKPEYIYSGYNFINYPKKIRNRCEEVST